MIQILPRRESVGWQALGTHGSFRDALDSEAMAPQMRGH
jgi:hypothetical protein